MVSHLSSGGTIQSAVWKDDDISCDRLDIVSLVEFSIVPSLFASSILSLREENIIGSFVLPIPPVPIDPFASTHPSNHVGLSAELPEINVSKATAADLSSEDLERFVRAACAEDYETFGY